MNIILRLQCHTCMKESSPLTTEAELFVDAIRDGWVVSKVRSWCPDHKVGVRYDESVAKQESPVQRDESRQNSPLDRDVSELEGSK